ARRRRRRPGPVAAAVREQGPRHHAQDCRARREARLQGPLHHRRRPAARPPREGHAQQVHRPRQQRPVRPGHRHEPGRRARHLDLYRPCAVVEGHSLVPEHHQDAHHPQGRPARRGRAARHRGRRPGRRAVEPRRPPARLCAQRHRGPRRDHGRAARARAREQDRNLHRRRRPSRHRHHQGPVPRRQGRRHRPPLSLRHGRLRLRGRRPRH
ncbi:hypothetical protein BN1708_018725, partial [Verticillium longisporum]